MIVGLNLGDLPPELPARRGVDRLLRQVEVGQQAGFRQFLIGHHYAYRSARWLQPFPVLARLAPELAPDTRVGTGILVAPLLDPIALAEEAATVAAMVPGRLVLGLGVGYREIEYRALGIPWEERVGRLVHAVEVARRLWAGDSVEVRSEEVPSGCWLEPELHPEVWIGAKSPLGVRLAAQLAAGFLAASKLPMDRVTQLAATYREHWPEGKPPPVTALRNLELGEDRGRAGQQLLERASHRMSSYQAEGLHLGAGSRYGEPEDLRSTALLGTAEDCRADLTDLTTRAGVGAVLLRASWPGMDDADIDDWIRRAGRALVDEGTAGVDPASSSDGGHA